MATSAFTLSSLTRAASFTTHLSPLSQTPKCALSVSHEEEEKQRGRDSLSLTVGRRGILSSCFGAALGLSLASVSSSSRAAILEADDDVELLEKVKKDRQKRLERQGVISSSKKETGYLQELVYKLSKVGQAIENSDFSAAGSALARITKADWLQNVNTAFTKLSSSAEEKAEVDAFNSSLVSLISSVDKQDLDSSRSAFVSSANALEKWVGLTGLNGQLKGL